MVKYPSLLPIDGSITHCEYVVRTVQQVHPHFFLRQHMHGVEGTMVQWWTVIAFLALDKVNWHSMSNYAMLSIERTSHVLLHDYSVLANGR